MRCVLARKAWWSLTMFEGVSIWKGCPACQNLTMIVPNAAWCCRAMYETLPITDMPGTACSRAYIRGGSQAKGSPLAAHAMSLLFGYSASLSDPGWFIVCHGKAKMRWKQLNWVHSEYVDMRQSPSAYPVRYAHYVLLRTVGTTVPDASGDV